MKNTVGGWRNGCEERAGDPSPVQDRKAPHVRWIQVKNGVACRNTERLSIPTVQETQHPVE